MRYLNKIIFINSAHIKFAKINLDGNVHFIGTQGVGKSTLLRAILFFYNADTLGLGIPRQKDSYTDYYFKNSNSYIIYEVMRGDEKFCVVSYKSQNKVCFRFFDGEFQTNYFVSESGHVPENWDGIAQQLDSNKIFYTKRKIDEHKEYRDILYGNHEGKKSELKRYSIIESKEYQYIPKTIQNVFLNSKMDAEFIKQTIIMSLDNDVRIELNNYTHHLKDFDTQLTDIIKFKTPRTVAQANSISKLHIAIRHLEREKIQLAKELVWALNKIQEQEPDLKERLEKQKVEENMFKGKLTKAFDAFNSKEKKITGEISVFEADIKKAKKLSDEYEKKNIKQIIDRVSKKPDFDKQQQNLFDENNLLSTQFTELSLKFQVLLEKLENQLNDFLNGKNEAKLNIKTAFLTFKDETKKSADRLIAEIRTEHKKEVDKARLDWEDNKYATHKLSLQKERIKHQRFFEKEISDLKILIDGYEKTAFKLNSENENGKRAVDTFQKQWGFDEKDVQKTFDNDNEKLNSNIESANKEILEIESYIDNSKSSMFGWLTENYPDWENTVGKVVDVKNVLFNTSLSPKLVNKSNNFYGIEIDLTEINRTVKTVADYQREKSDWLEKIEGIKKSISELGEKTEKEKENLKRKYQPKIREKNDAIKENDYLIEQNKFKLSEATVKQNFFITDAEIEKKKAIEKVDLDIEEAASKELLAKSEVDRVEEELGKLIKSKEKDREKKIEVEQEKENLLLINVEAEIKVEKEANLKRKNELNSQKENELSKKGADTKRLSEIETKLAEIKIELDFIEANRETVSDYKKDKRELFDKLDDFKNQKLFLEKQLEQEQKKYNQNKETITKNLETVQSIIALLDENLKHIKEDNQAFENFKSSQCYITIQEYFAVRENETETEKRVKKLTEELTEIDYGKIQKRTEELKEIVVNFLGKFSEKNIFNFKKQLPDTKSYLEFSEMLSDFVEENKIERIEKEVNERFSFIITTIGKETNNLVAESGKIQGVITKINNDFVEKNFAGVIKKIELKIDESKNEVVQLLIKIKKFNDENSFELGELNLFSSENQEKKNKDAIDLLKQFVKKIGEMKKDFISLSDSFELKFRIEENQNNTGWVEKLSNVGSEGTDVLVKAMLNIMLLNVFKEGASKRFKDFQLHCMMDEIGKLHPNNVRGILKFANERNILLINSSPIENDALAFKHIYKLKKDEKSITKVNRILTQYS